MENSVDLVVKDALDEIFVNTSLLNTPETSNLLYELLVKVYDAGYVAGREYERETN